MQSVVRSYQEVIKTIHELHRNNPVAMSEMGMVEAGPIRYPVYKIHIKGQSKGNPRPPSVFIAAGIHGDEPGGVWAALEFLKRCPTLPSFYGQFEFTVLPCTNPYGYEHNTRENAQGLDLNRQFRETHPPKEVQLVREAARDEAYSLAMEFHEDVDTPGFYLYELTQEGEFSWGKEMIARVAGRFPINLNSEIEGLPAEGGLIFRKPSDTPVHQMIERRSSWPQAFYHFANGTRHCFTTETPISLTRSERVEIHLMALDVALQKLWEQQPPHRP